jgi:hypothetical protein
MRVDGWYDKSDGREREREGARATTMPVPGVLCVCVPPGSRLFWRRVMII